MQTIGERLEEARKRKGNSIREAAEATKIRSDYLHKFESNQFDINLAEIYVRGFLRAYALYLGISADKILNDYAALGINESKQRQPSREVYGRMDLSVASSDEQQSVGSVESDDDDDSSPSRPSTLNRSGSSLPKGPPIPPTLIFRGGIALVVIIVLLLIYWGVSAIIGSGSDTGTGSNTTADAVAAVEEPTISLIALNSVRVKVTLKNEDGSPGDVLFPETTLVSGEVRTIPKPGPILIWATEGKSLQIEIKGKRYPMPFEGYNRAQIN